MILQLVFLFVFLIIVIGGGVSYLLSLQKLLQSISIENQKMRPSQVWLMLIPLFNIFFHYFMVSKIADSIRDECVKLNIPLTAQRPGYTLRFAMMTMYLISLGFQFMLTIPFAQPLLALGSFVCWIVYWLTINRYRAQILANQHNFLFDVERESQQNPLS